MRSSRIAGILNFAQLGLMAAFAVAACGGSVAPIQSSSGATIASGSSGASSTGSMASGSSGGSGSTSSGSLSSGSSTSGAAGSGVASAGSSGSAASGSATSGAGESGSAAAGSTSSGSATAGASSGTTGNTCSSANDCASGGCWLQLDGAKACVNPIATPPLSTCFANGIACCSNDADCAETNKTNPRCLPLIDVEENFCGGALPAGNTCRYDQCSVDADCTAQAPAGATVATCVPSGAFGLYNSACIYGGCRTDADCTRHPGGQCQYGLAATNGVCNLVDVLFCAYPNDPCQTGTNGTTGCVGDMICVPDADYQGRQCGKPPPAYP